MKGMDFENNVWLGWSGKGNAVDTCRGWVGGTRARCNICRGH